ncbi:MAG: 6,7-dimethyl-8-ribityllumazine synthase [Flavobacteriia bacterium]|nr:6,7-dimethyl-8-ribityllumazine synthase [Flavobacteriia bacterium]
MATANSHLSNYDSNKVPSGAPFTIHIVVSQWNEGITKALCQGALDTLTLHGVPSDQIKVWDVPGSFELIYGAKKAQSQNPDAVIAIGSVIQGETRHFEFICQAVAQGIKDLNVQADVPVVFCVLTDDTLEQAQARSGGIHGNKGVEAAIAALQMAALRHQ